MQPSISQLLSVVLRYVDQLSYCRFLFDRANWKTRIGPNTKIYRTHNVSARLNLRRIGSHSLGRMTGVKCESCLNMYVLRRRLNVTFVSETLHGKVATK